MLDGQVLLITGGTGSFGNAVLERFLASNVSEIRIFSRDEKKQDDLRKRFKDPKLKFYIGDVRDLSSLTPAVRGRLYLSCRRHSNKFLRANFIHWKLLKQTFWVLRMF